MVAFYAVFALKTIKKRFDGCFLYGFRASDQWKTDLIDALYEIFSLKGIEIALNDVFMRFLASVQ